MPLAQSPVWAGSPRDRNLSLSEGGRACASGSDRRARDGDFGAADAERPQRPSGTPLPVSSKKTAAPGKMGRRRRRRLRVAHPRGPPAGRPLMLALGDSERALRSSDSFPAALTLVVELRKPSHSTRSLPPLPEAQET